MKLELKSEAIYLNGEYNPNIFEVGEVYRIIIFRGSHQVWDGLSYVSAKNTSGVFLTDIEAYNNFRISASEWGMRDLFGNNDGWLSEYKADMWHKGNIKDFQAYLI